MSLPLPSSVQFKQLKKVALLVYNLIRLIKPKEAFETINKEDKVVVNIFLD